jgi:hypothetical protein
MTPDEIIAEREKTHGDFADNARISQTIRHAMRASSEWEELSLAQREALDLIALKIGRAVASGGRCSDHFLDIAGYARLGELATLRRG